MLKLPSDKVFIPRISIRSGNVFNQFTGKRGHRLKRTRYLRMMLGSMFMAVVLLGVVLFTMKLMENQYPIQQFEKSILLEPYRRPATAPVLPRIPQQTRTPSSVPPPSLPSIPLSEGPDNQDTYQAGRHAVSPPPISLPELPQTIGDTVDDKEQDLGSLPE